MKVAYPLAVERTTFELGKRLALARKARGFSQRDLAFTAGVGLSTVVGAEAGHPGVSIGNIFKLLDVLNLLHQVDSLLSPELDPMITSAGVRALLPNEARRPSP